MAVAQAVAQDVLDLRQGAEEEGDDDADDLADSSDDDEEPPKPPPPPPALAKLYAIPRDYKRCVEVNAELEGKTVKCVPTGPDYGDVAKSGSKFIHACKARNEDTYFSVPYDGRKIMKIGMQSGIVQDTGKTFKKEGGKYTEACNALNHAGRMYAAPCRAQRLLEIDAAAGTTKEVGPSLGSKKYSKWWAIKASCGGRIYAIPYDAPRVLEIDPNRVSQEGGPARMIGPDLGSTPAKYCCVEEAPNGNLYAAPLNARQVLEISPEGKVRLVGPDFGDQERKYACLVQAANRLLYAPPLFADRCMEINCARGDCREMGEVLGVGEAKYACAAVSKQNGKIYCAPLEARKVLEIDPDFHEAHEIGMDLGGAEIEKYNTICQAPEPCTKLYAAPRNAHFFLEICPRRAYVREVGNDHGRLPRKFSCIVPGAIWQGGMLIEKYKILREKMEEEYEYKLEKYERRREEFRMKMVKDGGNIGKHDDQGGSRPGSKQEGRSPSKMGDDIRRPSKMGDDPRRPSKAADTGSQSAPRRPSTQSPSRQHSKAP